MKYFRHLRQARTHLLCKTQHEAEKRVLKQGKLVPESEGLRMEHSEAADSPGTSSGRHDCTALG